MTGLTSAATSSRPPSGLGRPHMVDKAGMCPALFQRKDPAHGGLCYRKPACRQSAEFPLARCRRAPRDGSVTLIDTRSRVKRRHIDGFGNMPRTNSWTDGELDKSKPVYVTCQVGLRGYIACRILSQNGFECYNLSGGYSLYRSIFGESTALDESDVNPETQLPEK